VILGAGPVRDAETLRLLLLPDDWLVAADGGVELAHRLGRTPTLIVADFDSSIVQMTDSGHLNDSGRVTGAEPEVIRLPTRKDQTDTMEAAQVALERGYTDFLLLGCIGGRFDHTMANLSVLLYLTDHGARAQMADEQNLLEIRFPSAFVVEPRKDRKLSLLPFAGDVSGITVKNAAYPLNNATLTSDFPLGISNEFLDSPVEISFKQGILLTILSKD
jgi:thiamine pyrophosphokinase